MRKAYWLFVIFCNLSVLACAQQEIIYFNEEWQRVYSPENAKYYRILTIDGYNKPVGTVKDYYISGELQWQGRLSSYDPYNDASAKREGLCTWYYKNGQPSQESYYSNGKENGKLVLWDEYGNKTRQVDYKMGVIDGQWIEYHNNGKPSLVAEFTNGQLKDKWITACDEDGNCDKVFIETFADNRNQWGLVNESGCQGKIVEGEGLSMHSYGDKGCGQLMNLPFDYGADYSFECTVDLVSGSRETGHGIVWGVKDWDNYYYFVITGDGYYKIGARISGNSYDISDVEYSSAINIGYFSPNIMKIISLEGTSYYLVNGEVIHEEESYPFLGYNLGFVTFSGGKEIKVNSLVIHSDNPSVSNYIPGYETDDPDDHDDNFISKNNTSGWTGNGSGVIIDSRGYIATCAHVVNNASEIEVDVNFKGMTNSYSARVVRVDNDRDLAIIQITDSKFYPLPPLRYNFSTQACDVGSSVFTLGFPMALTIMGEEIKFTDGKISSKSGYQGNNTLYQVTVPAQPGNSGGPLFDYNGNLIGIVNSKVMQADNVTYAIKAAYLKNLVNNLSVGLNLPSDQSILTELLTEKIKVLSDYVVLIKIR